MPSIPRDLGVCFAAYKTDARALWSGGGIGRCEGQGGSSAVSWSARNRKVRGSIRVMSY